MRKLIIAVLVLISLDSFAQPLNYTWYKQRIRQYSHMVDSAFYVPRYNGTPSGVRTNENSAIDGAVAIDTANGRQYFYYNNSWRRLANYSELGVDSIWREAGKDSIFWSKAGNTYKIKDSISSGGGSSTPRTWTFVLSGQSNAWGANDATSLDTAANSRVLVWNHAETVPQWRTFRINQRPLRTLTYNALDGGSSNTQWAGSNNHTFYFAKKFANEHPNDTVKVIMAIGDGSPISSWFYSTPQKYLDSITTRVTASGVSQVDGFIWDQGEANVSSGSNVYKQAFDSIKQVLRRQTWFPRTTPIVVVGMPQVADGGSATYVGMDTLLRWMDKGDDLWVGYARTDSCLVDNNQVHFDTLSMKKIGEERIWQAFHSLPHRFAELWSGFTTDTLGYVRFNVTNGSVTESGQVWTMPTNSYSVDTSHYIVGDGAYEVELTSSGTYIIGLDSTKTNEFYYNGSTHRYLYGGMVVSGSLYTFNKGDASATNVNTAANIDAVRIARVGSLVKFWARVKDFYVPLFTYSNTTLDTLYPKVSAYDNVVLRNAKVSIYGKAFETSRDWIKSTGNVGIGTNSPTANFHLSGTMRIVDGNQGSGKVLTSDADGNATWQAGGGGGYTNLTSFTSQTAHRLFYSDASGDVQELSYGTSGQYLKSNGASSTPSWDTPAGSGSGTVNTGTDKRVAYYSGTGTTVDDAAGFEIGNSNNRVYIQGQATTEVPLIIQSVSSQTADLFQFKNSSGTVKASMYADGSRFGFGQAAGAVDGVVQILNQGGQANSLTWSDGATSGGYIRVSGSMSLIGTSNGSDFGFVYNGSEKARVNSVGVKMNGRFTELQGADVASANNLTLGSDGNTFEITGTTQVNLITNTNWQTGSRITLLLASGITIKHGQATSGSNITILLNGAADFVTAAAASLTLVYSEFGGTNAWREVSRVSY